MIGKGKSLYVWNLACALLICPLMGGPVPPQPQNGKPSSSPADRIVAQVPAERVKLFKVEKADMGGALSALVEKDRNIVIGFERVPFTVGQGEGRISLTVTGETVEQIVQRLCLVDQRYEFSVVEGMMIEVRPKGSTENPEDLLNIKIKDYKVDGDFSAPQVIESVNKDAPELRDFLRRNREGWAAKTGQESAGVAGSIISGNMPSPRFTLHLHDVTVRQILDAISVKSIEMFREGKNFGPTGWKYTFAVEPDSPTGLGGYPKWTTF